MRIISWNVRVSNPYILKGVDQLIKRYNPEIICLQELPYSLLSSLTSLSFYPSFVPDFTHHKPHNNAYICTLTKIKPTSSSSLTYYKKPIDSILNDIFYRKIRGVVEHHEAIITKIRVDNTIFSIKNARLSCAAPPKARLTQLNNLVSHSNKHTIVCGDFNIMGNPTFNILTGWTRAYSPKDYFLNERILADTIIKNANYQNPFCNRNTTILPLKIQFDHILIQNGVKITNKEVINNPYFSDHHPLFVEIE